MNKLTLVSVIVHGKRESCFIRLPVGSDGRVRVGQDKLAALVLLTTGRRIDRGTTVSIG